MTSAVGRHVAPPKFRRRAQRAAIHFVLVCGACVVLLPLAWMVSTSLKDLGDVFLFPPKWIPTPPRWSNYHEALTSLPFGVFFRNTAFYTGACIAGQLVTVSLVGFSFARLRWRGRDIVFMVLLATMMLPGQVTMIPRFLIFRSLGWINTFLPLIVPSWIGGGAFYIFLMRQFLRTIPLEMDEAARIDGCSNFRIYWQIVMPQVKAPLIAVAIFSFQGHWNDFMGPLIYLHTTDRYTVSLGLRMFQGEFGTEWHLMMAASVVAMLPILMLFFLAQRYFIQGVVFTGLKA
ncbi:MAG: carbohydrate ABC transporter permease [Anaerolineae bacterium]|nr:carbohydrate ABC transporter permease [Anaerolineae bacterium]